VGSLAGEPGSRSCPYCGRRIGPRFALGPFYRRGLSVRKLSAIRHLPHLPSAADQLREDVRYLAGIVGWPAAVWRVTRVAVLNILVVLVCVLVVALPGTHLVAKAITGAILAIQVGRLLLLLRQVRRDATRSRPPHRPASAAPDGVSQETARPGPLAVSPRAINLGQTSVRGQAVQSDPVHRHQSRSMAQTSPSRRRTGPP
jgi:hypothetical protein